MGELIEKKGYRKSLSNEDINVLIPLVKKVVEALRKFSLISKKGVPGKPDPVPIMSVIEKYKEYEDMKKEYNEAFKKAAIKVFELVGCWANPQVKSSPSSIKGCNQNKSNSSSGLYKNQFGSLLAEDEESQYEAVTIFSQLADCYTKSCATSGPASKSSHDPNDKTGASGYGDEGYIKPGVIPYLIQFENDPNLGATIPAQEVFITDPLDDNLNLATLEFTGFGFNNFEFDVPPGLSHYETVIDQRPDGTNLLVTVVLDVNMETQVLSATFRSLDPLTGQLPDDVDAGFLPVNDKELHNGEGYVTYIVHPKSGLPTGTRITNQASIVFDINEPILTPAAINTVDNDAPSSSVKALPVFSPRTFEVHWSGEDGNGSGPASYTIYMQDNGGSFKPWLTGTSKTSETFSGKTGHTYGFYSQATDNTGHVEAAKISPEATTFVKEASALDISLVWQDDTVGNNEIYFARSTDGGITWDSKNLSENKGNSINPGIARGGSNIYVTWQEKIKKFYDIYFLKSPDGGENWNNRKRILRSKGKIQNPAIAVDGSDVYVIWQEKAKKFYEIYLLNSTDEGENWNKKKKIYKSKGKIQHPAFAIDGSDIYIVWQGYMKKKYEIYFMHSKDRGRRWTKKRLYRSKEKQMNPSLAVEGSDIYIVWQGRVKKDYEIYLMGSPDSGKKWYRSMLTNNKGQSLSPAIGVEGSTTYVMWQDNSEGNDDLYFIESIDRGVFTEPENITVNKGISQKPEIRVNGSNIQVVWQDDSEGNHEIYFMESDDGGVNWTVPENLSENKGKSQNPKFSEY